jgi:hypothetical protein
MSSFAWAVAVQSATETLAAGACPDLAGSGSAPAPAVLAGLDEPTRSAIDRELTTAGITDDAGTIRPQWLHALKQSAAAPIQVSLVSRWDGFSTHCRVSLFVGKGLAVEFTRPVATAAEGRVTAVSVADVVTVTLLSEAVLWPVMASSMPRFPELTAGAEATVYLDVKSRVDSTGVQYHGVGAWALSDNLYSVRTTGPATARRLAMVEAPAGDIARQLVWHVLGAHDFLASGTPAESAS